MNKIKAFFLSLLAVIVGAFSFVSCGDESEKDLEGTYKFVHLTVEVGGQEQIILPESEYMGIVIPKDFITIKLESNGRFTLIMIDEEGGTPHTEEASWEKASGNKIKIKVGEASRTYTLKDGVLEFPMEGVGTCILEKESGDSGKKEDTSVVGYYEFYYLLDDNTRYYIGDEYEGITVPEGMMTISLSDEGKFSFVQKAYVDGVLQVAEQYEGTYETMDGSVSGYPGSTVVVMNKSKLALYKDGTLQYESHGARFVLKKK